MSDRVRVEVEFEVLEWYRGFAIVEHVITYEAIYQGKIFNCDGNGFGISLAGWLSIEHVKCSIDEFIGDGYELVDAADVRVGDDVFYKGDWHDFSKSLLFEERLSLIFRRKVKVEQAEPDGLKKTYDTLTEAIAKLEQVRAKLKGGE
jgi:hypothetical protein